MIKIENLSKTYDKGKNNAVKALDNVSLHIEKGDLTAIIGRSGSGKTTLLNIIGCIDSFESGKYTLDSKEVSKSNDKKLAKLRNEKIGFVMQNFALINEDTALENVMLPFYFNSKTSLRNAKKLAMTALEKMGIGKLANKPIKKLSGGQKQRVAIARAIVNEPSVILADEPTGALDSKTSQEIMNVFHQLNSQGATIIIVTHDMEVAKQCGRIIEIGDGKIIQ